MKDTNNVPIVIGFAPSSSSSGISSGPTLQVDPHARKDEGNAAACAMASPLIRNTSGRSGSSPGLLSLQLSLQHESKPYDDYYASDYDSDDTYSDAEGDFCLSREGVVNNNLNSSSKGAAPADEAADKRAHSQPIAIPTKMWIKDPAASTACCLLQRERAIRRAHFEQSEAYARQQQELQIRQQQYLLQQHHQRQQLLYAQGQQYLFAQGHL
ncbi:hypothetical protein DUNSADRAFT_9673 [Dunaliella salina]|uniref:Uncharacterized protein n=1 Tax=Dunaliella salina TaxID=3046 RepID=A0ABQ7GGZ7_DUNSA|nr:hypothetical protein DUNSADRAFT_9673 [Dunaliella salina]|eukprot:KAF5833878.1 hypothetical protein DUNSADRAFT_9673 [Dunaliella salina]